MSAVDEFVGETFEDLDSRSAGRRIRVLEVHADQWEYERATRDEWGPRGEADGERRYAAIRVDELGNVIGKQRLRISAKSLAKRYKKVSH